MFSIFFIPELISIKKTRRNLNKKRIISNNYEKKKIEYSQKLEYSKNLTKILQKTKDEETKKAKELLNNIYFYEEAIDEEKSDKYLTQMKNNEMYGLIKLYENNNISSNNIINNLEKYFKNHTTKDYHNNIYNILLASSIIKNESDIDFIYSKIINPFYLNTKNNNKKYILGAPCFKASMDTNNPYEFHKKCNNVGDTIIFIMTNKTRFGGITELPWGTIITREMNFNNTKTRLFNLDNKNIFIYDKNHKYSRYIPPIRGENYYFACFGYEDIYLARIPWESYSDFPRQFLRISKTNNSFNDLLNQNIENFQNNNRINFEYLDIEIYPIRIINNIK